jgi:hypothetical protein
MKVNLFFQMLLLSNLMASIRDVGGKLQKKTAGDFPFSAFQVCARKRKKGGLYLNDGCRHAVVQYLLSSPASRFVIKSSFLSSGCVQGKFKAFQMIFFKLKFHRSWSVRLNEKSYELRTVYLLNRRPEATVRPSPDAGGRES